MERITEQSSNYTDLEKMSISEILSGINSEDKMVAVAVEKIIPNLEKLISEIVVRMKKGGRLFYIGAGTSGRLGIVDASEIPPTFGVNHGVVIGIIAGGDSAIRKAVEFAEDDFDQAWKDLQVYNILENDCLIGIAASGSTPYVIGGLKKANEAAVLTGAIVCNANSLVAEAAKFPIEILVGPEFLTGSTRMKSGTAQKLVLNMLSTAVMIQLGKVKGNKMIDMQLTNNKLIERGTKMIVEELGVSQIIARELLISKGSVRAAIESHKK